jgi:PhnB protein
LSLEAAIPFRVAVVHNGLSAGGKMDMPIAEMFWGAYFGILTDAYGVKWMIDCPLTKVS